MKLAVLCQLTSVSAKSQVCVEEFFVLVEGQEVHDKVDFVLWRNSTEFALEILRKLASRKARDIKVNVHVHWCTRPLTKAFSSSLLKNLSTSPVSPYSGNTKTLTAWKTLLVIHLFVALSLIIVNQTSVTASPTILSYSVTFRCTYLEYVSEGYLWGNGSYSTTPASNFSIFLLSLSTD